MVAVAVLISCGVMYQLLLSSEGGTAEKDVVVVGVRDILQAAAGVTTTPGPESAAVQDLQGLHVQVAFLQEEVQRHEKMLRYVMDRFVEKDAGTAAPALPDPGKGEVAHAFRQHKVSEASVSAPVTESGKKAERRKGGVHSAGPLMDVPAEDEDTENSAATIDGEVVEGEPLGATPAAPSSET